MRRRLDVYWITGEEGSNKKVVTFVKDRQRHDRRCAINCDKIKKELGWNGQIDFEEGVDITIKWYMDNQD